jgi:copper chaperone
MTETRLYPNWKESVLFATEGPRHQELIVTDTFRAVLVGLEAGQKIPPHPTSAAAYHFLEGSGWMIVDGERLAVEAGATVVVPSGAPRGVEAETRLAFLGTQAAMKRTSWGPFMKYGPLIMFGLMIGVMIIGALMFSGSGGMGLGMLRMMMASGSGGLGLRVLGAMLLPFFGMLIMFVTMFLFYRKMAGGGPMSGMMSHGGPMSGMMGHSHDVQSQSKNNGRTTLTYNIPSVHCGHCKSTIEREVGKLAGVASVSVDVDTKQAVIIFDSPATKAEIEALLADIGYPPESQ